MKLINEARRMQQLAGMLNESPNTAFDNIALDYSNTAPNTPPGATPGATPSKMNEARTPDWDNLHQQLLDLEAYLKNNISDPDNKELLSKSMGFEMDFKNYLKKKDLY